MASVEENADLSLRRFYNVQTQQRGGEFGFTFEIDSGDSRWCSPWIKVDGATSHDEAMIEVRRQVHAMIRSLRRDSNDGSSP